MVPWGVCDTVVVVPEHGPVWFAKNSDREPSEAQFVECHDVSAAEGVPDGLPLDSARFRTIVSRPAWMWGCEMGVNEHGLAIGNEAVFTRIPVPKSGYTGMDFQRVALTNNRTAEDALEHLIELTEQLTQGGTMGHRHHRFRYHSSFLIADPTTAWVLETAGNYWAAKRVRGPATISNALTIEDDFDQIHTGAYPLAKERGWVKSAGGFGFASAFSHPLMSVLAGARVRRACTARSLAGIVEPATADFIGALTDHGAVEPGRGPAKRVSLCSRFLASYAHRGPNDRLPHRAARPKRSHGSCDRHLVPMFECLQARSFRLFVASTAADCGRPLR